MTLLIRAILVFTIIYLLVRSFVRFFQDEDDQRRREEEERRKSEAKKKGVSREIGEYTDYEEIK
ncbi:MAG: hypothetical protein WCE64_11675 [Bacteroidales bacterium]